MPAVNRNQRIIMPANDNTVRAIALEALLAHFPNPSIVALGMERLYGERVARALPAQMERLRAQLQRELRIVNSTNKTTKPKQ